MTGELAPRVTAVLVNWCREEDTAACIRSLRASEHPALRIVLVDNGSPDGSGARLRAAFPEVEHLALPENTGFTGGNNHGIRSALEGGCDYVLLLNNDTVVDPACVSRLVEAAQLHPDAGALGAKILYYDAPERIWFGGGDFSRLRAAGIHRHEGEPDPDPTGGQCEDVSFLTGCCMLIPAPVLGALGGFQEDLFAYVEDVELSLRLRAAGYRLIYVPGARLFHRVPLDPRPADPFKILLRDRNRRRVVRRHFGRAARLRFALFFYPTRLLLGARYVARGDRARAVAVWRGMTQP